MLIVPSGIPTSGGSGYTINNAVWFDGSADYLHWTPGGAPDSTRIQAHSLWVKLGNFSIAQQGIHRILDDQMLTPLSNGTNDMYLAGTAGGRMTVSRVMRDPTGWMHFLQLFDTTQATAANRWRIYMNGVRLTSAEFSTETQPALNYDLVYLLGNGRQQVFAASNAPGEFFTGHLAEIAAIDGTAYEATDFGEFDANNNWQPIDISGLTFGTNGYHLDMAVAPGTGSGAGTDVSGNANHFTEVSMTAAQQVTDTPSDDAASGIANYSTMDPNNDEGNGTFSNGNLTITSGSGWNTTLSSMGIPQTGKWGMRVRLDTTNGMQFGCLRDDTGTFAGGSATTSADYANIYVTSDTGNLSISGTYTNPSITENFVTGDWCELLLDQDAGTMECLEDGVSVHTFTGINPATHFYVRTYPGRICTVDFGSSGYTPSDATYKTLNTANLPDPAISDPTTAFQAYAYTGTGAELAVTLTDASSTAFAPDLVWIKNRDTTDSHNVVDIVRGATKELNSDSTAVESTVAQGLKSFDSSGFTLGTDLEYNTNTEDYIAWCWKAGGTAASNADGTITSSVSVNTTAGFSISTRTGNGTTGATFGHGLGVKPDLIFNKERGNTVGAWNVYHKDLAATKSIELQVNGAAYTSTTIWNDTEPTTSVITLGSNPDMNASGKTFVTYCWHSVEGYSKIGSYIGNGSTDGTFVYCGFRPAYVLIKKTTGASFWTIFDNKRGPFNVDGNVLAADDTYAEASFTNSLFYQDRLATGFKLRTTGGEVNTSAQTYIYMAFAEMPVGAQSRAR